MKAAVFLSINKDIYAEYKKFCKETGLIMSKQIELFMSGKKIYSEIPVIRDTEISPANPDIESKKLGSCVKKISKKFPKNSVQVAVDEENYTDKQIRDCERMLITEFQTKSSGTEDDPITKTKVRKLIMDFLKCDENEARRLFEKYYFRQLDSVFRPTPYYFDVSWAVNNPEVLYCVYTQEIY